MRHLLLHHFSGGPYCIDYQSQVIYPSRSEIHGDKIQAGASIARKKLNLPNQGMTKSLLLKMDGDGTFSSLI